MKKIKCTIAFISIAIMTSCVNIGGGNRSQRHYPTPQRAELKEVNPIVLMEGDTAMDNLVAFSISDAGYILINIEELKAEIEKWEELAKELAERLNVKLK